MTALTNVPIHSASSVLVLGHKVHASQVELEASGTSRSGLNSQSEPK